jgi:hypothetical protein
MDRKPGAARGNGFLVAACAAIFLCELCKGNRRRVFFDPASKLLNARVVCHSSIYHGVRTDAAYVHGFLVIARPACSSASWANAIDARFR